MATAADPTEQVGEEGIPPADFICTPAVTAKVARIAVDGHTEILTQLKLIILDLLPNAGAYTELQSALNSSQPEFGPTLIKAFNKWLASTSADGRMYSRLVAILRTYDVSLAEKLEEPIMWRKMKALSITAPLSPGTDLLEPRAHPRAQPIAANPPHSVTFAIQQRPTEDPTTPTLHRRSGRTDQQIVSLVCVSALVILVVGLGLGVVFIQNANTVPGSPTPTPTRGMLLPEKGANFAQPSPPVSSPSLSPKNNEASVEVETLKNQSYVFIPSFTTWLALAFMTFLGIKVYEQAQQLKSLEQMLKSRLKTTATGIEPRRQCACLPPQGLIYMQFPTKPEPTALWPESQWSDVTSEFEGLFFRAEGGDSAEFSTDAIVKQEDNCPIIKTVARVKFHEFGHPTLKGYPLSISLEPGKRGTLHGGYHYSDGDGYGSFTDGIRFSVSGDEVRPVNAAVRIWQRV